MLYFNRKIESFILDKNKGKTPAEVVDALVSRGFSLRDAEDAATHYMLLSAAEVEKMQRDYDAGFNHV